MKTRPSTSGVALIIVLSFLVLISAITLGFFSSVSTELAASKSVANSALTKQLSDSAVNVVMSQIVEATKGQGGGAPVAWASQPGMIRTFESSGAPYNFYKLYSSDRMIVGGPGYNAADEVPPPDWNSANNAELYTDLNAPAANTAGEWIHPIVDPSADGKAADGNGPSGDGFMVEGFSLSASPGFEGGKPISGTNHRAPMPVKWIYVLKDGSLRPASSPSATGVTVAGATTANPIVGRIAFWADDETAKVNINTASEGTYWDVPRIYSSEDFGRHAGSAYGMATAQPTQKEFQRYPGHPATTCLSPVFGSLLKVPFPYPVNPSPTVAAALDPYYNIAPRIGLPNNAGGGGSKGGSYQVPQNTPPAAPDTDRLYASVDELMFTPRVTGTARIPNTATGAAPKTITKGIVEKAGFFITANSTAPETTLYNTPRIAVWPISTTRTAYDSLLAFCSTIGGRPYYFTRSNPRNGTTDFTTRNAELYNYLKAETKADVPGFGGNFLQKYPEGKFSGVTERDQILTYLYDYIRCTNLQDRSTGAGAGYTKQYAENNIGAGEVMPIRIGPTQGFGRFLSISSANLLFYATAADASGKPTKMRALFFVQFATPAQGLAAMRAGTKYTVSGLEKLRIQIGTKPEESLRFLANASGSNGINRLQRSDLSIWHGRDVGGTEHAVQGIWKQQNGVAWPPGTAGKDSKDTGVYPFYSSEDIDVTAAAGSPPSFKLTSPAEILVKIDQDEQPTTTLNPIQTLHLEFPAGTFRVPSGIYTPTTHNYGQRDFNTQAGIRALVDSRDTIICLQVAGANGNDPAKAEDNTAGDTRMVESLIDVPKERFRAHNDYLSTVASKPTQHAHGLLMSTGERYALGTYGPLVPNANYYNNFPANDSVMWRQPDVPSRVAVSKGVTRLDGGLGDWDTGFGDQKDGAYINKPDEGDTALTDNTNGQTRLPYSLGYAQGFASATNTYFSPNRQIPSPLMFGSIPTGVQRMLPWQTLLFHPRPEDPSHPGKAPNFPKDHLLADLFWMPVVEPYAISQPFSTAGKINLNYQILPFTYINRSTGLHAAMKSTKFAAIPVSDAATYKPLDAAGKGLGVTTPNRRRTIDMAKTLVDFDSKFKDSDNRNNIFKSASQICEMNLIPPEVANSAGMVAFWTGNRLTGDNLREKPYVDLYSRLTTKSNTYTVHVRVQVLKKVPGTAAGQWVTGRDKVVGEYRGSSILERYIDLNDPNLPDFATKFASNPNDAALNIDQYYKMRVISTKRFAP